MKTFDALTGAAALLAVAAAALPAQSGIDLTIDHYGIGIGDVPRVNGIRVNWRDRNLEEVNGANITVWSPLETSGEVNGFAIGLPVTGAARITGVAAGLFGVGADERITGIGLAPVGLGAGGRLSGIMVGGVGVGGGGRAEGLLVGGVGVGTGDGIRGLALAGLGVGSGGDIEGITIAGIGVGSGGSVRGLTLGGIGVGSGGDITGITVSAIGVGSGGRVHGLTIAGLGAGAGAELRGVTVAGIGAGSPRLRGATVAGLLAGGEDVGGLVIAGAQLRVANDGIHRGASLSASNYVKGEQRGVTIGIFNYARDLQGLQLGLINVAGNRSGWGRVLPIANWHRD